MNSTLSPWFWFNRWFKEAFYWEPQDKEDILMLLRKAQQRELFNGETLTMIEGVFRVSEMHVRDVMIPRAQMVCLEIDAQPEKLVKTIVESGHSRFPVIGESRDDVQGIFLAKDLLDYYVKDERHFDMRDMMRSAVFIPESKRLNVLLREFRTSRNHMAIVVDEYSGVAGLVTIEDVIEQIVGEIDDEYDIDKEFITPSQNGQYLVKALIPIEEFNDYFKTDFSYDEFDTIGGVIMQAFGHLPKRGESLELNGFYFEVTRASGRRIFSLRVRPLEKNQSLENGTEEQ